MKKLARGLIIIIILVVAAGAAYFLFQFFQGAFTRAEDIAPHNVEAVEISENSAVISWSTDRESQAVVEYGATPSALTFFAPETEKTTSHSVALTLLSEGATYYFQIKAGDKVFDNAGVPWSFTTQSKSGGAAPGPEAIPTSTVTIEDFAACEQETDCEAIKEKIKTRECLAIHYSRCLTQETPLE